MIVIKSALEMDKMRKAGIVAAEILSETGKRLRPGITTKELEEYSLKLMKKKKVKAAFKGYMGYPGAICVSINEEVVHGIPGNREIKVGDIVSVDVGVQKDGYFGDTAATFSVEPVTSARKRLLQTTQEALRHGITFAVKGNHLGDISAAIQQYVEKNGFSVVKDYVGHGIGASMHEDPAVPNFGKPGSGPVLKPGMTLAIEPMVNEGTYKVRVQPDHWTVVTADGMASAHFEHSIGITESEPEVFTCLKKNQ